MKSRIVAGHSCLSLDEERPLYELTTKTLEKYLRELIVVLASVTLKNIPNVQCSLKEFNSLLWIYIQREGVLARVEKNIRLLWVLEGIKSINQFAQKLGLNPSFVGRVIDGEETGLGGWNLHNVMKMCGVLKIKPEVLLFADLAAAVRAVSGTKEVANDLTK